MMAASNMHWQSSLHSIALVFTAFLAVTVGLVVWQRRATPGGRWCALLMLALAEWALTSALEEAAVEIPAKFLFGQIEYLGIASVPPLWLMFALEYSQRGQWLTRPRAALLWITPVITMVMAATNQWHRLLWSDISLSTATASGFLVYGRGPWFWVSVGYSYLLLLLGTVVVAQSIVRFPRVYRRQTVAVLIGLSVPWVSNALYVAGRSPFPGLDLTPFAFTLTGVVFAWGIFRLHLFELVSVARDAVIENMSDGLVVLDAQNRIADINPAASRMIGATDSSPVGQYAEAVFGAWPDLVASLGSTLETQTEVQLGTAAMRYLDMRVAPLYDDAGGVTGRVILLRDINERKLLDQLREDLTHALVHDLRNPLTSISGSLEMLAEDADPVSSPVRRELVEVARANTQRMLGLVDSILEVHRLEAGQLPLDRKAVQLAPLVAEVLRLQAALAGEKRLHLVNAVPADLPPLWVDTRLTGRVLQNLVDNAIKFTPVGGTIRVTAGVESAQQLAVSVSDDGPGIPAEIEVGLFQKFVRGAGRGSGLGLAFCRLAVEAHGGRIWAESGAGKGTTVSFTLPLAH
jgi:PAS domain S-box-containing protein